MEEEAMDKAKLVSAHGLVVAATCSDSKGESDIPPATDDFCFIPKSTNLVIFKCGHRAPDKGDANFYGWVTKLTLSTGFWDWLMVRRSKICPECLLKELKTCSIRCALCGHIIIPGDAVAAYGDNGHFNPKWVTRTPDGEGVLGCMRWHCCPSGGFFAGHWTKEGFRSVFDDGQVAAEKAMATGQPVYVPKT